MRVWNDSARLQGTNGDLEGTKRYGQTIASLMPRRIVMALPQRLTVQLRRVIR
jgi:hypothetical protein